MPITMQVIGSVASPLSGASTAPTIEAVETMTVLLPPASACATASTMALRRASASSTVAYWMGSATADMSGSRQDGFSFYRRSIPTQLKITTAGARGAGGCVA